MSATIRDVAAAAGVSPSTVSRAFGRPRMVDDQTRGRILDAAAALDYQPNRAAQFLTTGRSGSIGLVVPDLTNPFFPSVVKGVQRRALALGYPVLLGDTDEDPDAELPLARTLARQVDGLVLCSPRMTADDLSVVAALCPVVLVNRRADDIPAVAIDNAGGIDQAVTHLRALGHRRVGYVAGPAASRSNAERDDALGVHTAAAGISLTRIGPHEPSVDGGRAAADAVLLADVTAVLVYNDIMAIGLISQLTGYGIAVPTELSVIGFDDIDFASMFTPALTTVRIPRERAGCAATDHLDALLTAGGTAVAPPDCVPTELVVRGTTARATDARR